MFMFKQVSETLGLGYTPSAFQIRLGGCKGVLSTWPSLDGERIQIRDSMKKFESDHNKLDIVNYSSPGTALLRMYMHCTVCYKKSDAKIEITITATNLIRIKYPLSSSNYHLSRANVANFNKIHCTVFEQQMFKQVAQLSQRDRAAGWVSNGQKWKTGTERQYLRTI